ncbi:hypothetical protein BUALT_Bualt15G0128100 [Buddleja alternifolia]|uniref:Uncharacterized protein n=1 Tax=Buddleja alternifolia TaxID=168488 RepID=A0AAV6WFA9_9LAMI|nr:hypothetical protein BUALT_Bualt15G0128100 [Buddleja alternifolia]
MHTSFKTKEGKSTIPVSKTHDPDPTSYSKAKDHGVKKRKTGHWKRAEVRKEDSYHRFHCSLSLRLFGIAGEVRAKSGGLALLWEKEVSVDLRDALDNCRLFDLGCIWYQYTWCNRRMTTGTTKERLDRIVLHKNGFLCFLEQRLFVSFLIQWDLNADGNAAHRVWEKVQACRVGLINWSKSAFGNKRRKRNEMKGLMNSPQEQNKVVEPEFPPP